MKMAMPVEDQKSRPRMSASFGRSPYYYIVDDDLGEAYFITNTASQAQGGAGVASAQLLVDEGIDVLLTPRCGEKAMAVLVEAGILLYECHDEDATNGVDCFKQDRLKLLKESGPSLHRHGGQ